MYIAMKGNRSPRDLRVLADNVVSERLQQAPDVSAVNVTGGEQREIRVSVHADRLTAYGVTIGQLAQAINQANQNVSAGYIQTDKEYASIRFLGEFASVKELQDLYISLPGNGHERACPVVRPPPPARARRRAPGRCACPTSPTVSGHHRRADGREHAGRAGLGHADDPEDLRRQHAQGH